MTWLTHSMRVREGQALDPQRAMGHSVQHT